MELYPPKAVMQILGIDRGTLSNLVNRKFFTVAQAATTRGATSYYSKMDITKFYIIRELNALGVSQALAAEVANDAESTFNEGGEVHEYFLDPQEKYTIALWLPEINNSLDFSSVQSVDNEVGVE